MCCSRTALIHPAGRTVTRARCDRHRSQTERSILLTTIRLVTWVIQVRFRGPAAVAELASAFLVGRAATVAEAVIPAGVVDQVQMSTGAPNSICMSWRKLREEGITAAIR